MSRLFCIFICLSVLVACNPAGNEATDNIAGMVNEEPAGATTNNNGGGGDATAESIAESRPTIAPEPLPTAAFDIIPQTSIEGGTGTAGTILYTGNDQLFRIVDGGEPENITPALDALSPLPEEGSDRLFNISPDGQWIILETERFGCGGWHCIVVLPADLSNGEAVRAAGEIVHIWDSPVIASGGNLIVYADTGGPHEADLYALNRVQGGWNPPVLLTEDSPFAYNSVASISDDGQRVVFQCGDQPFSAAGTALCEALTDGSEFRILLRPEDHAEGTGEDTLSHPDYDPTGGIIFGASWRGGSLIWRVPTAGEEPQQITAAFDNDNNPCVMPDGDIVSFWLGRDGNQEGATEIKRMTADGANYTMVVTGPVVFPVGVVCGA